MRNGILWRIILAVTMIALPAACSGGGGGGGGGPVTPSQPAPSSIDVMAAGPPPHFAPSRSELAVGGRVTWTNTSPVIHEVVATSANWMPGQLGRTLAPGQSFQTTISAPGIYAYRCTIHDGMNGSIEVR